jgi:oxygen-independent coproporphyrinogen-3 oxidase
MAGIYLHIPFCKKACNYCNFHFSTSTAMKADFVDALILEIELRKDVFSQDSISSIYFGGGTPSLLSTVELNRILDHLHQDFNVDSDVEITLEANPDDLSQDRIKQFAQSSINRLSIGVQSFRDSDLKFMHRVHNSTQALESIKRSQDIGLSNITIDLIYGTPGMTNAHWLENLQISFGLQIPHISSYALTVEDNTPLKRQILSKKSLSVCEHQSSEQFKLLMKKMKAADYEQYEISNFCKEKAYSRHNSSYWQKKAYLGLGPSAHSFIGNSRSWNVSNNQRYIQDIRQRVLPLETEILSQRDQYNEYIMTSLRTIWGCDISIIKKDFPSNYSLHFLQEIKTYLDRDFVKESMGVFTLSDQGKLFANRISSDLFLTY